MDSLNFLNTFEFLEYKVDVPGVASVLVIGTYVLWI